MANSLDKQAQSVARYQSRMPASWLRSAKTTWRSHWHTYNIYAIKCAPYRYFFSFHNGETRKESWKKIKLLFLLL